MKSVEPAFDPAGEFHPASLHDPQTDIRVLENTIAKQSSELNLRLTEVLELYNVQARHADELQAAHEEIDRLQQTNAELLRVVSRQRTLAAVAQEKIIRLEGDKAALSRQHALALLEIETLMGRMNAMQAILDAKEANATSALAQIDHLNSEVAAVARDRFKLVATVQSEKRRHNQQASFWEDKIKNAEGRAGTRAIQVKHLEEVRRKLDKRIQVLEALRDSEREAAERKIGQLTDELKRCQLSVTSQ